MTTYAMTIDWRTGAVSFRGSDGRVYSADQLSDAELAAAAGDEDALTTLATLQRPAPTSREDAQRLLEAEMDDCPLCREARARGEEPIFVSHGDGREVDGWFPSEPPRPANWWHGKRPKRRR